MCEEVALAYTDAFSLVGHKEAYAECVEQPAGVWSK